MVSSSSNISEVARIREEIEINYLSAKSGLSGLAAGTSFHRFITARMERMRQCHEQLEQLVGGQAVALVAETLNTLPDKTNRQTVIRILGHELEASEETMALIDWIQDMWETIDTLMQRFGEDTASIIIHAPPIVPSPTIQKA